MDRVMPPACRVRMTVKAMIHSTRPELPPITIRRADFERLAQLAEAAAGTAPTTAEFLADEIERATVVPDSAPLAGVVGVGDVIGRADDIGHREAALLQGGLDGLEAVP